MRNEAITYSIPFLNDTKKLHPSNEINGLKKYPEVREQRYGHTGLTYSPTIGLALLLTALHCQKLKLLISTLSNCI